MAETIGSLTDKICIAELKIFHLQEQVDRANASSEHRALCAERVKIMKRQRDDLVQELDGLVSAWRAGRWVPKVYRQFKMYNDPKFRIANKGLPTAPMRSDDPVPPLRRGPNSSPSARQTYGPRAPEPRSAPRKSLS